MMPSINTKLEKSIADFPVIECDPCELLKEALEVIVKFQKASSELGECLHVGDLGYKSKEGIALRNLFIAHNQSLGLDQ